MANRDRAYIVSKERDLSIEEMIKLAEQVDNWKASKVLSHPEKRYSFMYPSVYAFHGNLGEITLELGIDKGQAWSELYSITVSTHLNILGHYEQKQRKFPAGLVELFSKLRLKYKQGYCEKIESDEKEGLAQARRLLNQ